MSEQNKALAINWFREVWDKANPDAIGELFAADGHCYGFPEPDSVLDFDQFKAAHRQFLGAFSGIHVEIEDLVVEGDKVAIRWTAHMTHSGDALGFPATGKSAALAGSSFIHVRDGKIQQGWNHMDFTRLALALQAAP
jgi:steroid delta-isomerase-like uncharacterized protein